MFILNKGRDCAQSQAESRAKAYKFASENGLDVDKYLPATERGGGVLKYTYLKECSNALVLNERTIGLVKYLDGFGPKRTFILLLHGRRDAIPESKIASNVAVFTHCSEYFE